MYLIDFKNYAKEDFKAARKTDIVPKNRFPTKIIGVKGVGVINPYYWVLSDDNLYNYYAELAEATKLLVLLYTLSPI